MRHFWMTARLLSIARSRCLSNHQQIQNFLFSFEHRWLGIASISKNVRLRILYSANGSTVTKVQTLKLQYSNIETLIFKIWNFNFQTLKLKYSNIETSKFEHWDFKMFNFKLWMFKIWNFEIIAFLQVTYVYIKFQ